MFVYFQVLSPNRFNCALKSNKLIHVFFLTCLFVDDQSLDWVTLVLVEVFAAGSFVQVASMFSTHFRLRVF